MLKKGSNCDGVSNMDSKQNENVTRNHIKQLWFCFIFNLLVTKTWSRKCLWNWVRMAL